MLTFTSAVCKLNLLVLGQHHTLLHVISKSYCRVMPRQVLNTFDLFITFLLLQMADLATKLILITCFRCMVKSPWMPRDVRHGTTGQQ